MEYKIDRLIINVHEKSSSMRGTLQEDEENYNMRDYNSCMDGIETFIMFLAEAGVDVGTDQFKFALEKAKNDCGGRNIL